LVCSVHGAPTVSLLGCTNEIVSTPARLNRTDAVKKTFMVAPPARLIVSTQGYCGASQIFDNFRLVHGWVQRSLTTPRASAPTKFKRSHALTRLLISRSSRLGI